MIVRWDALLLAAVLSGGSMLIENSHRIDTGLADDAVAASAACSVSPPSSVAAVSTANDDDALPACD